jgi:hypothetical protein
MTARHIILAVVLAALAAAGPAHAADLRSERALLLTMQSELAALAAQLAELVAELQQPVAAPNARGAR